MTNSEITVTVITVTYNSSAYVRDAIESVLAQTHSNIEYIIGDDCSTDNTWEIIQDYKDPRIRAYRNEVNLREYPNRNKAIKMASGKYLIFIDGDDIIYPHGVAYFVSLMENFPEAAMAIQKNYVNNLLYPVLLYPQEVLVNNYFGKINLLSSSFASNFFNTSVLIEKSLKENLKSGDDEVRLRIAAQHPVLFVQGWVSWPRETPGQAGSKISIREQLIDSFHYSIRILNEVNTDMNFIKMVERKFRRSIARLMVRYLIRGNITELLWLYRNSRSSLNSLVIDCFYNAAALDFLSESTPAKPFKRGFLNKL